MVFLSLITNKNIELKTALNFLKIYSIFAGVFRNPWVCPQKENPQGFQ